MDDLRQPGPRQLRFVLPAPINAQLGSRQGGGQQSPPDQLHQSVGQLLDHFLEETDVNLRISQGF